MGTSKLTKSEVASKFIAGDNCSQCVLTSWADELGYDEEELMRMASAFGGGMFRGDTCGAITGALIALGLAFGDDSDLLHDKVAEFRKQFVERFGNLNCRDLVKYDFSIPGERDKAMAAGATIETCPALVCGALEILDDLLEDM